MTSIAQRCGPRRYGALAAGLLLAATLAPLSFAQQPQGQPSRGQTGVPMAPKGQATPRDSQPGTDSALRQRVEQLEEQLVDMQVALGTLESLARGTAAPAGAGGYRQGASPAGVVGAADAGRLDSIETQIRALAAQLEHVQEQVRALSARSGELTVPGGQVVAEPGSPRPGRPQIDAGSPQPEHTQFGSVTVSPGSPKDEIDRILTSPPQAGAGPLPQMASAPPGGAETEQSPKQLYETAYGYLLQRDYGAAEAAFDEFLRRHSNDPLAGNAQYWLGESLYVRGQYRAAAGAFLKGYQTYSKSAKAPESLLKLAMSLQRLGQKDAACSSFSELTTKFPSAPSHVKTTAQTERQRAGC
jgi:tol-pal system protein YbgF